MIHPRRAQDGSPLPLAVVGDDAPRRGSLPETDDSAPIAPRHGAPDQNPLTEATGTDGDFATPRRPMLRLLAAPVATLAVVGLAYGAFGLTPQSPVEGATAVESPSFAPQLARGAEFGTSRDLVRPALASATPSSTPSAKKPSAKPAVRVTKKATPNPTPTAKPSAKKTATPSRAAKPEVDLSLGDRLGARYATTAVRVRKAPSTEAAEITVLAEGEKVIATTREHYGWRQVSLDGRPGWVRKAYLTTEKPAEPAAAQTTDSKPSGTSKPSAAKATSSSTSEATGSSSSAPCPTGSSVERGLNSGTIAVHRAVCHNFGYVKSYGGLRPGDGGAHGSGRALDIMVSGEPGWAIARWARANASRYGITEVIYSQQIWTRQRSSEGWRPMSDRGGVTANHYDHVHVTVG